MVRIPPTPPADLDTLQAGLDLLAGHHGLADWARTANAVIRALPALLAELHAARAMGDAAIALTWSESGTDAMLRGDPEWQSLYDDWPEMTALVEAIDQARPGWREQGPPHV